MKALVMIAVLRLFECVSLATSTGAIDAVGSSSRISSSNISIGCSSSSNSSSSSTGSSSISNSSSSNNISSSISSSSF